MEVSGAIRGLAAANLASDAGKADGHGLGGVGGAAETTHPRACACWECIGRLQAEVIRHQLAMRGVQNESDG